MNRIEIKSLCKSFAHVRALDNISFDVESGEIFGLVGADGSGRTTLLRILATLSEPDSGSLMLNGCSFFTDMFRVRSVMGYVPATFSLYSDMTVKENLDLFISVNDSSLDECYEYIEPIYRKLLPFSNRMAGKLSGGMKQKLAICCALVRKPQILLLDEPTTGIDTVSRQEVWDAIHYLNRKLGITVIVATPYRNELLQCHRVALIEAGKITDIGTPDHVVPQDIEGHSCRSLGEQKLIVQVNNLTKKFGDFTAVDSISFNIREGEVFGFLGANGAGKTTTLRMICGLLAPTSGSGQVAGFDILLQGEKIKSQIGYLSQKFQLYNDLTVKENLSFIARIYGMSRLEVKRRVNECISLVGLSGKENVKAVELPLGLKQKLAFAASIIHSPAILLLDEPTSGVDSDNCRQIWSIIDEMAKNGTTVFVTTHNLDEAWHCDRIMFMSQGTIRAIGEPSALISDYGAQDMNDLFFKLT